MNYVIRVIKINGLFGCINFNSTLFSRYTSLIELKFISFLILSSAKMALIL